MSKIHCNNWDSFDPEPMELDGKSFGILMPRMTQEQLNATPGIQGWSRPEFETRVRQVAA